MNELERTRSLRDRTSNNNSIALRPRTSLVWSQYGSYVCNTTISFSVRWHYVLFHDGMAFQNNWVGSNILRGHLDQTRPNSSITFVNRSQYVATKTTPFSRRSSLFFFGRTENGYKCRGITRDGPRSRLRIMEPKWVKIVIENSHACWYSVHVIKLYCSSLIPQGVDFKYRIYLKWWLIRDQPFSLLST